MSFTDFLTVQNHFHSVDPKLAMILDSVDFSDWLDSKKPSDYFTSLTRDIIYQQLHGKAAGTIFGRFKELIGGEIVPESVIILSDQSIRDVGLSWAKVKYVKDLATQIIADTVNLASLDNMTDEEVIVELTKVKGIGPWTAEMFLLFTLKREDIFSYGDLGLKNGFVKLYGIEEPTQAQISEIVSRWSPYRSYGSLALWHHLDNR
jgi:DNA-3-methyladenine glycosylase II